MKLESMYETDLTELTKLLRAGGLSFAVCEDRTLDKIPKLVPTDVRYLAKSQIIITGPYGTISCIRGGPSFGDFEIFSLEGNLFENVQRFGNAADAANAIEGYLRSESK